MVKHLVKILLNRGKSALINAVIEILLETLNEFKRASQAGVFDVHKDLHQMQGDQPERTVIEKFNLFKNPKNREI